MERYNNVSKWKVINFYSLSNDDIVWIVNDWACHYFLYYCVCMHYWGIIIISIKKISSTRHHLFLDTWARVVLTLLYFALIDGRKKHSIHCFRILNWMILRRAFSIFQSGFQFIPRIFYIIPMYVCENLGKSETCSCFGRKQSCLLIVCFRISLVSCWNSFKRYRIESLWMTFDPLFNETIFNLSL